VPCRQWSYTEPLALDSIRYNYLGRPTVGGVSRHGRPAPAPVTGAGMLGRRLTILAIVCFLAFALGSRPLQGAAPNTRPFHLPFSDDPGPSTWLLGQAYGNTTTAFRWRLSQYAAGQGMHFGIDFSARCGTPVAAIGAGVVTKVDAPEHGAGPHNLMVDHPNGYASFYGHLYERPPLSVGDIVSQGQLVGLTGDPDETCTSRPHLHLEIRDAGAYRRAFNPVPLIEADWDALTLVGSFNRGFERDLADPRRWQHLDDQPDIVFHGPILNHYRQAWPPEWSGQ
jgi:murein DD-endopeptidase MepM/ murein hydrolase activator NlpD